MVARNGVVVGAGLALWLGASAVASGGPPKPEEATLRCPSAICHSGQAMGRLTPAYRLCMSEPGAKAGDANARLVCSRAELRRQDGLRLKLQRQADLTLADEDPRKIEAVTEMTAKWDVMRDRVCRLVSLDFPADPGAAHAQAQCGAYLAIERSLFLEHVIRTGSYS